MSLHPSYFTVSFKSEGDELKWPDAFVIVTAFATTGEVWPVERNIVADQRLRADLSSRGFVPIRITGYSPETGHTEPGWAVEMTVAEGIDLGQTYLQDAIFVVRGDELFICRCAGPVELIHVGQFRERITSMDGDRSELA